VFEWSDLRVFLAVARDGSTVAAAKALGVNQTTVARRIAALEGATGLRLFDRRQDGYRLSEAGAALVEHAEKVEAAVAALEKVVGAQQRHLGGVIRVTTPEELANRVVTPWLTEFMDLYPDIRIEMVAAERRLDLAAGEADVAIRAQKQPDDPGVVVRKLSDGPWALYCSEPYAEKRGAPCSVEELACHNIIGGDGPLLRLDPYQWLAEVAPPANVRSKCVSLLNVLAAIKAGHGVGALPCSQGVHEPALVECMPMPDFGYSYYLVANAAVKDVPRVRAFLDFIIARAAAMRHLLDGRSHRKGASDG
jgi:DNA-binding transcriptional LysR family regulator